MEAIWRRLFTRGAGTKKISEELVEPIRKKIELLVRGYAAYFHHDEIFLESFDFDHMAIRLRRGEQEDGKSLIEEWDGSETLEKAHYLGYQINDFDLKALAEPLRALPDGMHLNTALIRLACFIQEHPHLFLPTSIRYDGFESERIEQGGEVTGYRLYYREQAACRFEPNAIRMKGCPEERLLAETSLTDLSFDPDTVYVVNPTYYHQFGEMLEEVVQALALIEERT
ncbi:hypothetical protein [Exiguobacterium flavidum]|uniref:hypothetical protein n=1 Tax=Exiguobacterium flavidum TaxID=2184695 RepID=UPI000DF82626|nr:hypothetical protein [Exiguobacterium flavidum]